MMTAVRWVVALLPAAFVFWRSEVWMVDNVWEEETWTLAISGLAAVGTWFAANWWLTQYIN